MASSLAVSLQRRAPFEADRCVSQSRSQIAVADDRGRLVLTREEAVSVGLA